MSSTHSTASRTRIASTSPLPMRRDLMSSALPQFGLEHREAAALDRFARVHVGRDRPAAAVAVDHRDDRRLVRVERERQVRAHQVLEVVEEGEHRELHVEEHRPCRRAPAGDRRACRARTDTGMSGAPRRWTPRRARGRGSDASDAGCARRRAGAGSTRRRAPSSMASCAHRTASVCSGTPATTSGTAATPSAGARSGRQRRGRLASGPRSSPRNRSER